MVDVSVVVIAVLAGLNHGFGSLSSHCRPLPGLCAIRHLPW